MVIFSQNHFKCLGKTPANLVPRVGFSFSLKIAGGPMKEVPVARTESLIVKEVDGETLVYDLKTDKAHCLNNTAARVWQNCDGRNTVSDIATLLGADLGVHVKDEVVWLALDQLTRFKLLKEATPKPALFAGMT